MLLIDGSYGEGGGQILRTSLALSLATGQPFRIVKVRAGRKSPGLLRQHLTAVNAAAQIGRAEVKGASMGSDELMFAPREVVPGEYHFAVGTAGSTSLIFQTLMPALMLAREPTTLTIEGGTHNPFAPTFDFLDRAFLPLVRRLGPKIEARLGRAGFYPAGGGLVRFEIEPARELGILELQERGEIRGRRATALVASLPQSIAERELAVVKERLSWSDAWLHALVLKDSHAPGNAVSIEIECEHVTELFTGFGARGVMAEEVAEAAVKEARQYLSGKAAAGEHMADQLIVPLALAGRGLFTACRLSRHARTNIEVIQKFLDVRIETTPLDNRTWRIEVVRV